MKRSLLLILMLAPVAACASAQAKSPAERPNLDVPLPPPRTLEPLPVEAAPPEPVSELPTTTPPATSPSRPRPQPPPPARDTAKPEPKPEPPAEPPATAPPPQLRTPAVPDNPQAARQIRDVLDRALRMLNNIDYRVLSTERQASYDTAKNFINEGRDALKASNYLYAKELADKAERLAKELQGR